jgi:pimeloyl-ACP methyl ester carboxylesterase
VTGAPAAQKFVGAHGNTLVGDAFGDRGPAVLLLHGGGQTRHAWLRTAQAIAQAGMTAYAVDQRGHGDSDWLDSGAYGFNDFAADARALADQLAARTGARPSVVGASLGGVAALISEGEAARAGAPPLFAALVLVDITPRVDYSGIAKVQGFMRAHAREGFASVADAADAVAAYLPHRPRPRSHDGLQKNLRLHPDGRWRWHWDPRFLESRRPDEAYRALREAALADAAKTLKMPVLLVRGGSSELVQEDHAKEFLELVPHASYAHVAGARHMVAGDQNDQFSSAILDFLNKLNH